MEPEAYYLSALVTGSVAVAIMLMLPARPSGGGGAMALVALGVAAFGASGLASQAFGSGPSFFTGLLGAALVAGIGGLWFRTLRRSDEREDFERVKLVGMEAVVTEGIEAGRVGRVSVQYAGMTRSLDASSAGDIARGTSVVIDDVTGGRLVVSPLGGDGSSDQGGQE